MRRLAPCVVDVHGRTRPLGRHSTLGARHLIQTGSSGDPELDFGAVPVIEVAAGLASTGLATPEPAVAVLGATVGRAPRLVTFDTDPFAIATKVGSAGVGVK